MFATKNRTTSKVHLKRLLVSGIINDTNFYYFYAERKQEPVFVKCDFWVCKPHSIPITGGVLDKQHEQKFIKKEPTFVFPCSST